MELAVAAGVGTGAGLVYAAGSDEGLGAFLILPSAAISSNDARREGVICFVGCAEVVKSLRLRLQRGNCLQQLLQYASPGCVRAYALISSRTPGSHIGPAALPARGLAGEATLASL